MTRTLTKEQMAACLKAQQGEVDAVAMYERLAKKVKDDADKKAFARLAGDEARHAAVFQQYTNRVLKPKPTKRIAVPAMYQILGKKRLYPIIARKEYDAADKYQHLIADFPEIESVMNDEVRHGDAVLGLL